MLLLESSLHFRLSRSELAVRRAWRRILRSDRQTRRMFGVSPPALERRREPRQPLRVPINLRPAQTRGLTILSDAAAPPFLALTCNISQGGVGFVHDEPLPAQQLLAEFDVGDDEPLLLLVESCWTVATAPRAYRSGVRTLGVARRPELHAARP